jgi:hypothetical protein
MQIACHLRETLQTSRKIPTNMDRCMGRPHVRPDFCTSMRPYCPMMMRHLIPIWGKDPTVQARSGIGLTVTATDIRCREAP